MTDWDLKDRRIAWMNINTACSVIEAARINAGLFKPKNREDAIQDLLASVLIEFEAFLKIGKESHSTEPQEGDSKNGGDPDASSFEPSSFKVSGGLVSPSDSPKKEKKGKTYMCMECQADITEKEMEYSEKWYGKALCRKHQGEYRKRRESIENAMGPKDIGKY